MLLQDQAGVSATGAGGVIVDHARVIRTVHLLTRPADYLGRGGDGGSDRRNGAVTCPHEGVSGLPSLGKDVIDQAGLCRRARARIGPAESDQLWRVAQVGIVIEKVTAAVLITRREATVEASLARRRDLRKLGMAIAAMISNTLTTMSSSIREKPFCFRMSPPRATPNPPSAERPCRPVWNLNSYQI